MRCEPVLWSDFDGTAVEVVRKTNPRNWSKYPLEMVEGYHDFLNGFTYHGGRIGGVVSRRPDIAIRRAATRRSIADHGLQRYFDDSSQIVHTGSEIIKAAHVLNEATKAPVGLIDDKPHRVGSSIVSLLSAEGGHNLDSPIILGAVHNDRQDEYVDKFLTFSESVPDVTVEEQLSRRHKISVNDSYFFLYTLRPYSYATGRDFASGICLENGHSF